MDPLRLLSRGTKSSNKSIVASKRNVPSAQDARPHLFAESEPVSRKRKRALGLDGSQDESAGLDFFKSAESTAPSTRLEKSRVPLTLGGGNPQNGEDADDDEVRKHTVDEANTPLPVEERKSSLKRHKLKVTWLNPPSVPKKSKRKAQPKPDKKSIPQLFPDPAQSFRGLHARYGVSQRIESNVLKQGYNETTEVQMAALPLLLGQFNSHAVNGLNEAIDASAINLLTVAPTGSGKTLAFLIPMISKIANLRRTNDTKDKHTTGLILAPTKELVGQIVNEGRKLVENTGIRISQYRKGMQTSGLDKSVDAEEAEDVKSHGTIVKSDILVSTPGVLHTFLSQEDSSAASLSDVQLLVLDEADVLLDPLFRDQTVGIWQHLTSPDLSVSLWSATMGSNIEDLTRSIITNRRKQANTKDNLAAETPLIRLVVGLKDSAVPNVQHNLIYAASEQGKLMGLRQLLHPSTSSADAAPTLRPPFLVFTQTVERAIALHSELLYDIPAEAGGIGRIAVLHSALSDTARDDVMTRFRKGEIWVLITTDLLSRGVDFRGVNGVVNYDVPTSSATYVHRVGRTGRAGREGGLAITLYSKEDIPYLKHVANVVAASQRAGGSQHGEGVQKWLLDALPTLSKTDKQKLKKHGIEARTSRGKDKDARAARKARITTKAGYVRREENNRKGAIEAHQRRAAAGNNSGDDSDFGGFESD